MALCGPGHNIRVCSRLCYRSSAIGAQKSILPATVPATPHTVTLYYYCTRQLTDLFLLIDFLVMLGFRVRYCISCHTPFFSHTINISNDQALILDINYYWKKNNNKHNHTIYKGSKHNETHSDTQTHIITRSVTYTHS